MEYSILKLFLSAETTNVFQCFHTPDKRKLRLEREKGLMQSVAEQELGPITV